MFVDALHHLHRKHRITGDGIISMTRSPGVELVSFNDHCKHFANCAVIGLARAVALLQPSQRRAQ